RRGRDPSPRSILPALLAGKIALSVVGRAIGFRPATALADGSGLPTSILFQSAVSWPALFPVGLRDHRLVSRGHWRAGTSAGPRRVSEGPEQRGVAPGIGGSSDD